MMAPDNSNPTVAVVTLHNSPNYGSCLQTYATQKVLASVGFSDKQYVLFRSSHK